MDDTADNVKIQLLTEGGIEGFVQSGRIPLMTEPIEGVTTVVIFVPPEGTQRGDGYRTLNYMDAIARGESPEGMGDMGTIEFLSPDGTTRGLCDIVSLTREEYDVLLQRRRSALEILRQTERKSDEPSFFHLLHRK